MEAIVCSPAAPLHHVIRQRKGTDVSTAGQPQLDTCLCVRPQIRELASPGVVYNKLMELIGRLAELGLVHCDFNEFNVLVRCCGSCVSWTRCYTCYGWVESMAAARRCCSSE